MRLHTLAMKLYEIQKTDPHATAAVTLRHMAQELEAGHLSHVKELAMRKQDDIYANFPEAYELLVEAHYISKAGAPQRKKGKKGKK